MVENDKKTAAGHRKKSCEHKEGRDLTNNTIITFEYYLFIFCYIWDIRNDVYALVDSSSYGMRCDSLMISQNTFIRSALGPSNLNYGLIHPLPHNRI